MALVPPGRIPARPAARAAGLTPASLRGALTRLRVPAVALAAVLACAAPASAFDPRIPLLGPEPSAEAKVAAFRAGAEPAQLAALEAARARGEPARDLIHHALLADTAYAEAYAGFERAGDNAEAWAALLEGQGDEAPLALRAHALYFLARSLLARDDIESAVAAFELVRGALRQGTAWTDDVTLYLAYAYARVPDLEGAEAAANLSRARHLLGLLAGDAARLRYPDAPERVVEAAVWLQRELSGEGLGPLMELAKRMETIERLLRRTRTDEGTRRRQDAVVSELDRLIALMREQEQSGQGGGQGGRQGGRQRNGRGPPQGNQQSGSPADQSALPTGDGREGPLAEGVRGAVSDEWGRLRERDREEAVQFLREHFPSRYREIIEGYYRAVAEEDR